MNKDGHLDQEHYDAAILNTECPSKRCPAKGDKLPSRCINVDGRVLSVPHRTRVSAARGDKRFEGAWQYDYTEEILMTACPTKGCPAGKPDNLPRRCVSNIGKVTPSPHKRRVNACLEAKQQRLETPTSAQMDITTLEQPLNGDLPTTSLQSSFWDES